MKTQLLRCLAARAMLAPAQAAVNVVGGGTTTSVAPGGSVTRGSTVTVTITLPTNPQQPPLTDMMGQISPTAQGAVVATFVIPGNTTTGARNVRRHFPATARNADGCGNYLRHSVAC